MLIVCRAVALLALVSLSFSTFSVAQEEDITPDDGRYYAVKVSQQLDIPESEMDYAEMMLAFNALVDPDIDVEATRKTLNDMADEVKAMAGRSPSNQQLLSSLRQYIYDAGEWNNNKPFTYDHDDPLGTYIPNKLIPNYLKSKRGNCVSMPTLFLVLGQKLGLNLTLSTAPNHVFVQYHTPNGQVVNIETTSGGHPVRPSWMREHFHMTDKAIENGMYLKTLSPKQTAAILASLVLEDKLKKKQYGYVVHIAELLTAIYPEYDLPHIARGLAFQAMLEDSFLSKYPNLNDIPKDQIGLFNHLAMNADQNFNRVEALGHESQPKK